MTCPFRDCAVCEGTYRPRWMRHTQETPQAIANEYFSMPEYDWDYCCDPDYWEPWFAWEDSWPTPSPLRVPLAAFVR